ncbi:MAG: glycine cleavage system protein GcvH [Calditrichaeota bacterium]|nr:glycine cleavage system protein GcvH [Calditrichota bacterium]MCB9366471.1 glycine cleavage system protein GcvH [Calditrichota bacterium]MCB9391271.1 glycine cleavage system protein GcvH [Calditrichota bacterium]
MNIPANCLYTKEHEWVRLADGAAVIGVTDFAQGELGDVVFVQLPPLGSTVKQGDSFGTIEAVKAVADLYAPISGEILEVNSVLDGSPEVINREPYTDGWIVKIKPTSIETEKSNLMTPEQYKDFTSA